jgi:hypothetical protein
VRKGTATRTRRTRTALTWLLANLVLGYLTAFPLLSAVVFTYYVRAKVWGTVSAPYHQAEAEAGAAVAVLGGGLLITAAVLVNRALRRRLDLRGRPAFAFWTVTAAVLLTPFLCFWLNELTVPEMLGKGLLRCVGL